MRQFFRHTVLWLIALSILNTSIDFVDTDRGSASSSSSTNTEYNEIESIAEFLLDETTDQTLPDQKGNDEQGLLKKSVAFDFSLPEKRIKIINDPTGAGGKRLNGEQNQSHLPAGFTALFTPPPDRA